jgi:hypothetical protein
LHGPGPGQTLWLALGLSNTLACMSGAAVWAREPARVGPAPPRLAPAPGVLARRAGVRPAVAGLPVRRPAWARARPVTELITLLAAAAAAGRASPPGGPELGGFIGAGARPGPGRPIAEFFGDGCDPTLPPDRLGSGANWTGPGPYLQGGRWRRGQLESSTVAGVYCSWAWAGTGQRISRTAGLAD